MNIKRAATFLILYIALTITMTSCSSESTLDGEVFIVTQGSQSIKLGLVEVMAIPEVDAQKFIEEKNSKAQDEYLRDSQKFIKSQKEYAYRMWNEALEKMGYLLQGGHPHLQDGHPQAMTDAIADAERWRKRYEYINLAEFEWPKGGFYYNDLPLNEVVEKATTNADGKFTLTLPSKGKYLLVAHSQRQIADSKEEYYWLIWVFVTSNIKDHIMLSNNNLFGTNASESVKKIEIEKEK
ncbi:MAG: hypothetical protein NTX45_23120 [Proteobacteria bacterium]|nr:hypothetical protein [Pseudomonadota bacterium]